MEQEKEMLPCEENLCPLQEGNPPETGDTSHGEGEVHGQLASEEPEGQEETPSREENPAVPVEGERFPGETPLQEGGEPEAPLLGRQTECAPSSRDLPGPGEGPCYGTAPWWDGARNVPQPPRDNGTSNPYQPGYYRQSPYVQTYYPGGAGHYGGAFGSRGGGGSGPVTYVPAVPVEKKNGMTVASLILGVLAMAVLNYFPFPAFVMGIMAICTAYTGLQAGALTKGKRVCGYIGLALGIISLVLSVTMLVMLLSLTLKTAA